MALIWILSDLHLEGRRWCPPTVDFDVLVLAGDIGSDVTSVQYANALSRGKPTVLIVGNHEYYRGDITQTLKAMRIEAAKYPHVHLLDKDEVVIDDIRFLGATLWTDFKIFGDDAKEAAMAAAMRYVADFRYITVDNKKRQMQPSDYLTLFAKASKWLEQKLGVPFDGQTIVVTHHAPHPGSIAPQFADDLVTAAFVSNLEYMMGKAAFWIHGHTHSAFDYIVNGAKVICNPRGYGHETNLNGFRPGLVLDTKTGVITSHGGRSKMPAVKKDDSGRGYVLLADIEEPHRALYQMSMKHQTVPLVTVDGQPVFDAAWEMDWLEFVARGTRKRR